MGERTLTRANARSSDKADTGQATEELGKVRRPIHRVTLRGRVRILTCLHSRASPEHAPISVYHLVNTLAKPHSAV